ncbi:6776_t:CDS:2 [Rhizophagus irregularis]|nr:6776_t:CDS:2 [Rhizophagus irregularis]
MSISQERFEELEALRTKLDVSFDMVSTLVDSWIGKNGIKNKAVSEMILKRKLIRKNNQKDDEDDVSSDPMRHTNKNEDLEDSKISIKKSKVNSMDNDNISKKQFGGDFLSIYLAERDKKKKRKNSKNKIS